MSGKELEMGEMGEFDFIRSIRDGCIFSRQNTVMGIGDDCAVIGPYGDKVLLITTDLLVEDIHFILESIPPEHLGRKAAAVNLSDIAAMGGAPLHLFLSLAVPSATKVETLHAVCRGIKELCRRYRVNILGGDTSSSKDGLMISIAVLGEAPMKEVLYRTGARPGDLVYVTGKLGDSAAGLLLIRHEASAPDSIASPLVRAHTLPVPHLKAGRLIAGSRLASAMIDLSDGLVSDLGHVCEQDGLGARLTESALPLSGPLREFSVINGLDPYVLALSGGEDYRLLITVPFRNREPFEKIFEGGKPCHVHLIGEIVETGGMRMVLADGTEKEVDLKGFDHFARAEQK
jgi:thiamine-monophosphate kinase